MLKSKSVLIVDDEVGLLTLLERALEDRGYEVYTADNAVAAGILISSRLPGLILMDIRMPGINGLEACEALKKNPATKEIPIIIITALSDDADKSKARKIGVVDYFTKPLDLERLISRIAEIV